MDKWMDITDMGYVIASRYNLILVSLSQQQSMTFFPLRSQPLADSSVHHIICIGHVYGNHFVQVHSRYIVLFLNLCNKLSTVELILFLHVQQVNFKRPLSFTACSIVMVYQLSSSGKAVTNSIY